MQIVVMGVSGCGKSTVGALLAQAIGAIFIDGDSLHPHENVQKMAVGTPLNDDDRRPWLEEIGRSFAAAGEQPVVIACSALKVAYRDIIRSQAPQARFVHLHGTTRLLTERMETRPGHFMPTSLLNSQLQTLEPLTPDELGIQLNIQSSPADLAVKASRWLGLSECSLEWVGISTDARPAGDLGESQVETNNSICRPEDKTLHALVSGGNAERVTRS